MGTAHALRTAQTGIIPAHNVADLQYSSNQANLARLANGSGGGGGGGGVGAGNNKYNNNNNNKGKNR
jgi:hypothetical protein